MNKLAVLAVCLFSLSWPAPAQSTDPKPGDHAAQPASNGVVSSWRQIPVPPLRPFKPQDPRRIELPNGMVIFLQEDHELPLIDGVIRIRGGSRDEPADKTGLTEIYSEVWRTGGTKSLTGDQLDDFLESRAARIEPAASQDSTFLTWSSLKDDFDKIFPVVLDVLENPEFRQVKIELAQQQFSSAISRRNDDMEDIARRESVKLAYGADNPYARTPEYYTVAAVTRDDLLNWHQRTVVPNNMILGISGDFDSAAIEAKLRQAFGALPRGEPLPQPQVSFRPPAPGIYFIAKNDVNQSAISMVDLGIDRHNPDYFAIQVMNEIFGGGFASRLFSNIRTKQGLAYDVGGGVGSAFDHPGLMRISMGTKSSSTGAAIEALRRQLNELLKGGVTEREVKRAKDSILNSFIFEFDSTEKVLAERMRYEFYGFPPDFLERYRAGIEKVTPVDVDRVARKYFHPERLAILVVGNARDFDRNLASFGKVTTVDISIPQKKPGM
ncbi:MAG TPA: pitrilysin family protein [Terriglobales bacterium]